MEGYHRPVLLKEAIEALGVSAGKWYLDATIGDGGHSLKILKRGGGVVGLDVDPQALARVQKRFDRLGVSKSQYILVQGNFRNLQTETKFAGAKSDLAGVLFDLGVSSLQLETPKRGFSFGKEGPLDMRMDPSLQVLARDLVNAGGRKELSELFDRLGEEKHSRALADAIVSARQVKPVETTMELAGIVAKTLGRRGQIHPATKVFQALRIAVNDELSALQEGLEQALEVLNKNGRMVVISFHSLEDRIVKSAFNKWQDMGLGQVLTKKPVIPLREEIAVNPRSRSAKMRIFCKT